MSEDKVRSNSKESLNPVSTILSIYVFFSLALFAIGLFLVITFQELVIKKSFINLVLCIFMNGALIQMPPLISLTCLQHLHMGVKIRMRSDMVMRFCLIALFIFLLYFLALSIYVGLFIADLHQIRAEGDEAVSSESTLADFFNTFFFKAGDGCDDFWIFIYYVFVLAANYSWIWNWIDAHCPSEMKRSQCQACSEYSLTFCPFDAMKCSDSNDPFSSSCPYPTCRTEAASFIVDYVGIPVVALGFLLSIGQIVLLSFTATLFMKMSKVRVAPGDAPTPQTRASRGNVDSLPNNKIVAVF